jgi:hypothetical protein
VTQIRVLNPSNEPRAGIVEIRVKTPVAALQHGFAIEDQSGNRVQSQLDVIDPNDRTRDMLVLRLNDDIPPNGSVLLDVITDTPPPYTPGLDDPRVVQEMHGVKLINHLLDIYISLVPEHILGSPFYAGAATSVNMTLDYHRRQEFLDSINMFEAHDLQKRCMQIDSVQVSPHAQHEWLTNKNYEVIAEAQGPLRATMTIATEEFDYGPSQCRLYRAISIYRDDAIVERVHVRDGDKDLEFTARYFAYMDMGLEIFPVHYRYIFDWLSINYK